MNQFSKLALLSLAMSLAACSTILENDKVNYKGAVKGPALDVPPDLTQLSGGSRYTVPGAPVTALSFQTAKTNSAAPTAINSAGDVRIERVGNQRWLVVNRSADKLPQDFVRSTLGKMIESLYSTGERDKFRTRLERNADGGTEVFITHRGMIEVYSSAQKDSTVWQPRATDPELEAEFLSRLLIKLGTTPEQSKALMTTGTGKSSSRMAVVDGKPVIQIDENFDRAWRRVGLSLDRTSFTVEDRDRSKGIYFVRYVEPGTDKTESGFLSSLFGSSKANTAPLKYRVALVTQGVSTTVSVQNAAESPETSSNAQRILKVIADDLQ